MTLMDRNIGNDIIGILNLVRTVNSDNNHLLRCSGTASRKISGFARIVFEY